MSDQATEIAPTPTPDPVWRILTGAAVFSVGVYICGAIGSYNPIDPSWNSATNAEPTNLFGGSGAVFADVASQLLGWSAWLAGFLLLVGGGKRACLIGRTDISRWAMGAVAIPFSAACFASWPVPATWPLASGLGGLTGDGLFTMAHLPFAALKIPNPDFWAGLVSGVIAFLLIAAATGFNVRDGRALVVTLWQQVRSIATQTGKGARSTFGFASTKVREQAARKASGDTSVIRHPEDYGRSHAPSKPVRAPATAYYEPEETDDVTTEDPSDNGNDFSIPVAIPTPEPERRIDEPEAQAEPAPITRPASVERPQPAVRAPTHHILPSIDLLTEPEDRQSSIDEQELLDKAEHLSTVLGEFGVKGRITEVRPGPVVTLFEFEPAPGVKSARVIALADDIARSMSAMSARVAVIPGKNAIGIELPNDNRETVHLHTLLRSKSFQNRKSALPLALGEDISGTPMVVDLAKMPHLLIAGTTGSGKSVGINAMILSLMFRHTPEQCRFIMIDPKMLELSIYEGIPHLLSPVVIDPKKAVSALKWTVREMESRYELMSKAGVRNLNGFNDKVRQLRQTGGRLTREVQTGYDQDTGRPIFEIEDIKLEEIPNIVVVIDEMADLMMVAGKEIEGCIQRLAQMARAAGIHLITATQRPSVDVITGTIKANFPTRISYMVTSRIDSRTILGEQGAEQLLGMGDLLYMAPGGRVQRLHGPFVSDEDVQTVVEYLKSTGEPEYVTDITEEPEEADDSPVMDALLGTSPSNEEDELYGQALAIVLKDGRASTSYIQRRLKIGYNRAASIIERLEDEGVISGPNHAGKREILKRSNGESADAA